MQGPIKDNRIGAADSIPQPTSGRTNIKPYIVNSDAVAARRSGATSWPEEAEVPIQAGSRSE